MVNKRVWNAVLGCNLKNDRMISVRFQGKSFSITVIQVYAPTSNAEEAEVEGFYEDLQDLLELTPKKDVLFIISSVQSLSHVQLFATPWTAARQASLSITNSWSSLRLTSIDSWGCKELDMTEQLNWTELKNCLQQVLVGVLQAEIWRNSRFKSVFRK